MAVKNKQLSDIKIVWKMLNLYHIASDTVNIKRWGGAYWSSYYGNSSILFRNQIYQQTQKEQQHLKYILR